MALRLTLLASFSSGILDKQMSKTGLPKHPLESTWRCCCRPTQSYIPRVINPIRNMTLAYANIQSGGHGCLHHSLVALFVMGNWGRSDSGSSGTAGCTSLCNVCSLRHVNTLHSNRTPTLSYTAFTILLIFLPISELSSSPEKFPIAGRLAVIVLLVSTQLQPLKVPSHRSLRGGINEQPTGRLVCLMQQLEPIRYISVGGYWDLQWLYIPHRGDIQVGPYHNQTDNPHPFYTLSLTVEQRCTTSIISFLFSSGLLRLAQTAQVTNLPSFTATVRCN